MTYDAPPLDLASFAAALINYLYHKVKDSRGWFDSRLWYELANGAAIPPILVLMLALLFSDFLDLLKAGSRVIIFLSGAAALLAILDPRRTGIGPTT